MTLVENYFTLFRRLKSFKNVDYVNRMENVLKTSRFNLMKFVVIDFNVICVSNQIKKITFILEIKAARMPISMARLNLHL